VRSVVVPENVVTGRPFTPTQFIEAINALGCPLTVDVYSKLLLLLATCEHQGTHDRGPEQGASGEFQVPIDKKTGEPLQEENPYDAVEEKFKRLLWVSLQRHFHLVRCGNRWPDTFEPAESEPTEFPRGLLATDANPAFRATAQNLP
jgi:hypothetical protein